MTVFRRGDVVLVAFPFTDLTTAKMRPALVISSDSFQKAGIDIILAGITSQTGNVTSPTDILLCPEDQNLAGLRKPSLVRLGKIVTLDQRLVRGKLGTLPVITMAQLTSELHKVLSSDQGKDSHSSVHEPPAVYIVHAPTPGRKPRGRAARPKRRFKK
jgi:mRNA interferase MazF